jgi:hypothetical protein
MADQIRRIQDLRPGDIMFGPIGGAVGLGVGLGEFLVDGGFRVGPMSVRHVGVVVEAHPGVRHTEGWPNGIMDEFRLVQAMPGGAEEVTMTISQHWTKRHAYARLPEDYPGQAADAAAIARLMVIHNVGYSYASYLALAAWRWRISTPKLEAWIGRRQEPIPVFGGAAGQATATGYRERPVVALPVEAVCSVLADQAWTLAGKKIFDDGRPHQCVTPSQLAGRLLTGFEFPGVIWGWPGVADSGVPLF